MISTPPRTRPACKPAKKEPEVQRQTFQPLSKREIDERIERVMSEVAGGDEHDPAYGLSTPRWITPRELVERMKRFLVYN